MADDDQRVRRIAAAAYDYDRDPRWADYWSNVLIPPNMASRSSHLSHHYKRKFYKMYIDPDLVLEPMSSCSSSQASGVSFSSGSSIGLKQRGSYNSVSGTAENRSATTAMDASSLTLPRQMIQFLINAWILVVALLAIVPLVPRYLAGKSYRLSLLGTLSSSLYTLYIYHGKPGTWNLRAFQTWFQSIIGTKDFIYLVYCLVFIPFPAVFKFALQPLLCRVIMQNAKFLRRNFNRSSFYRKYLDEACLLMEANTTTLNILSSNAEVALGFLLIFSLFSCQRSIIQAVIYWQLLKLMYHAPATASYHQSVWSKIGQFAIPFIQRYAPFLNVPLSAIQRWWLS